MLVEGLLKYIPSVAILIGVAVGVGEIKADVSNLKQLQDVQYQSLQKQLDNINLRLNQIQK